MSVTGLNQFYDVRDFSDMRCKHSRVLSIIREQIHREPNDGDVLFVSGYQFMKVCHEGGEKVYRIDWRDVVLLLDNPMVKELKIR